MGKKLQAACANGGLQWHHSAQGQPVERGHVWNISLDADYYYY